MEGIIDTKDNEINKQITRGQSFASPLTKKNIGQKCCGYLPTSSYSIFFGS